MISNDNLIKLLKEKLSDLHDLSSAKTTLNSIVTEAIAERTPLQQKIIAALKLAPGTADEAAICKLSDDALAGRTLLSALQMALDLSSEAKPDQLLAEVARLKQGEDQAITGGDEVAAIKKTTLFVAPDDVQRMLLHGLGLPDDASAEAVAQAFIDLRGELETFKTMHATAEAHNDELRAVLAAVRDVLSLEPEATHEKIVERVRSDHALSVEYATSVYFGESVETLLANLQKLLDTGENRDPDIDELLDLVENVVHERDTLSAQTKSLAKELSDVRARLKDTEMCTERQRANADLAKRNGEELRATLVRLAGVAVMLGEQADAALGKFVGR
jgi:hypothetical protein